MRALRARLGTRFLLVTRGRDGMSLFTAEGVTHLPVHGTDQIADVTGAGDTVIPHPHRRRPRHAGSLLAAA